MKKILFLIELVIEAKIVVEEFNFFLVPDALRFDQANPVILFLGTGIRVGKNMNAQIVSSLFLSGGRILDGRVEVKIETDLVVLQRSFA